MVVSFAVFLSAQHEVRFVIFPCQFNSLEFLRTCFTVIEDHLVIIFWELELKDIIIAIGLDSCRSSTHRTNHLHTRPWLVRINLLA